MDCILGPAHTNPFSNENGAVLLRICFVRVKQFKGLSSESLSNFRTESITLKVKIGKNWITVVGIYRPPSIPLSTWSHELSALFEAASTLTNTVFYAGDFNADLLPRTNHPKMVANC